MNSTELGWGSLMHSDAPSGCRLKRALFTTYDRPDERLFAEHLLPLFMKLGCESSAEGSERSRFVMELDDRLKQLHERVVVVSSLQSNEASGNDANVRGAYPWIWRDIRHLTVGRDGNAVQHAKLWMLHWGAKNDSAKGAADGGAEYLEIVVSSANLTMNAFEHQMQAVWRVCIALKPQGTHAQPEGWSMLPAFLTELALSAGNEQALEPFIELLRRADCPEGVRFVASAPGNHSRQTLQRLPWGAAGLQKIAPPGRGQMHVAILSPYVGAWNVGALNHWCSQFYGDVKRIRLVWIDKQHPWAEHWLLPLASLQALDRAGANLVQLRYDSGGSKRIDPFHKDHRQADSRWSHAKVYAFQRGNSRRLLVTSANFSQAAWGKDGANGALSIENFELGVCLDQADWPFAKLQDFDGIENMATVDGPPERSSSLIKWASAEWDGRTIAVSCRWQSGRTVAAEAQCGKDWVPTAQWEPVAGSQAKKATLAWKDAKRHPGVVRLSCEDEIRDVPIFDARDWPDRKDSFPPEVDAAEVQALRDDLLFERFGGRVAEDGTGGDAAGTVIDLHGDHPQAGPPDSYAVPAFEQAREQSGIVDTWAIQVARLQPNGTSDFERKDLRRDGERLGAAFDRKALRLGAARFELAIGATLAAEEMKLRLRHFPEA